MGASRLRTAAVLVVLVGVAAILPFAANAVLRPGCSLLPVALSDEKYVSRPATLEQACAVLGRPLPQPRVVPAGAHIAGIGIDGPPPTGVDCCRMVHVEYSTKGRNFASLNIQSGESIPVGNVGEINATLAGVPAIIHQQRRPTLEADDVLYLWARDGLLYVLHVLLADGITREAADEIAASIR